MVIKNPTEEELVLVDNLATGVFMQNTPFESMAAWFECLLGKRNVKHINCVFEDDLPVTIVNWYSASIKSECSVITVGSIGAVCSDEKARGKGYANTLLLKTFEQMKKEGIALCFISGRRDLYLRNGSKVTGKEFSFEFDTKEKSEDVNHITGDEVCNHADIVYKFHSKKENRFIRSFEHTAEILKGFSCSHHNRSCELFYTDNGYVVADIDRKDLSAKPYIIEYGGKDVLKIFRHICFITDKAICGRIERDDKELLAVINNVKAEEFLGSLRIMDIGLLFEQIKYKFRAAGIADISVSQNDDEFAIACNGESYYISEDNLYTLIFTDPSEKLFKDGRMPLEFNDVFPLHIPKVDGLDNI